MNEIKATAATWEDIKRLSEENERLKGSVSSLKWIIRNLHNDIEELSEIIGDLKGEND